jgi:hypothetical protein
MYIFPTLSLAIGTNLLTHYILSNENNSSTPSNIMKYNLGSEWSKRKHITKATRSSDFRQSNK